MNQWWCLQAILLCSASFNIAIGFTRTHDVITEGGIEIQKSLYSLVESAHQGGEPWNIELIKMSTSGPKKINNDLPAEFDARKRWSNCSSIGHIYDQSACGL
ncbi:hypothetical protein AB6A40_001820 [Gnathostoma spinigerum]|uniref:Uncharacterized protein n=1 Tax=Gnathostoma spinigerum TaxID=75299 RepID=A0ABD6E6C4_9BILA